MLLFFHECCIHTHTVIFHHAGVDRSGTLDSLADETMPGNVVVEPVIEGVIQLQCPVAVCAGIPAGVPVIRVQFIEEPTCNHFLEGRQFHTVQIRNQLLQTAIGKVTKLKVIFQCQLGCYDGVVHRLLHHDSVLVQEHGLESQIVRDLHDPLAIEDTGTQVCHNSIHIRVLSYPMPQGNVSCGACCNRNGNAGNIGFMGIQRRILFLPVCIFCSGFKVEGYDFCITDVCVDFCNASDGFIILHIVLLFGVAGRQLPAAPVHAYSAAVISTLPANTFTCSLMARTFFCSSAVSARSTLHTT